MDIESVTFNALWEKINTFSGIERYSPYRKPAPGNIAEQLKWKILASEMAY